MAQTTVDECSADDRQRIRHVPVVDGGEVVGTSRSDVVKFKTKQQSFEIHSCTASSAEREGCGRVGSDPMAGA